MTPLEILVITMITNTYKALCVTHILSTLQLLARVIKLIATLNHGLILLL